MKRDYMWFTIYALFGSLVLSFAPWMSGPYWADVVGTFICTHIIYWMAKGVAIGWNKWTARKK